MSARSISCPTHQGTPAQTSAPQVAARQGPPLPPDLPHHRMPPASSLLETPMLWRPRPIIHGHADNAPFRHCSQLAPVVLKFVEVADDMDDPRRLIHTINEQVTAQYALAVTDPRQPAIFATRKGSRVLLQCFVRLANRIKQIRKGKRIAESVGEIVSYLFEIAFRRICGKHPIHEHLLRGGQALRTHRTRDLRKHRVLPRPAFCKPPS